MQTMIKLRCKLSDLDLHCLPGPVDQKMVITKNLMVFFFFKLHEHLSLLYTLGMKNIMVQNNDFHFHYPYVFFSTHSCLNHVPIRVDGHVLNVPVFILFYLSINYYCWKSSYLWLLHVTIDCIRRLFCNSILWSV